MVKHIILWNLKDEFNNDEVKNGIKSGLESLVGKIPRLLELEVIINPLKSSNADVMLYSVFEDKEALSAYSVHPEHIFVADTYVRPFTKSRACMDYEVEADV